MTARTSANPAAPVLAAMSVTKAYGGVQALKGVGIELFPGEVHGLCGENGSGKSTLLKILSAQIQPDAGHMQLNGTTVSFKSPFESLAAGIATVTQERTLVPQLTVAENVMLGHTKSRRFWGIDWRATRLRAAEILTRLNLTIDVEQLVSELPPGQAQLVEIARAISDDMKVLILDEPTSSLSTHEVEALFGAVQSLREHGVAIVFISHRMQEVFDLCDRITILRDGELVSTGPIAEYSPDRVVEDMLGRELSAFSGIAHAVSHTDTFLEFHGVSLRNTFSNISFSLGQGEILGVAGLVGAGHSELVESLFGLHPEYTGSISVQGRIVELRDPSRAMRNRIAFVPGDRKAQGLVLDMSVLENGVMASTATKARFRNPRFATENTFMMDSAEKFNIVTENLDAPVVRLSGGNQQKVLLSKWIGTRPEVLVLDEPTRGVDVGAKAEIYRILLQQREAGMSILVSSSEVPELLALCDRIIVMHRGSVAGVLARDEADEDVILRLAMGHDEDKE
jgi:rhamnose transport system ATP-binding protein